MALQLGLFQMAGKLGWPRPPDGAFLHAPSRDVVNKTLLDYLSTDIQVVEEPMFKPGFIYEYHDLTQRVMPNGKKVCEDDAFAEASRELQKNGGYPLLSLTIDHKDAGRKAFSDLYGNPDRFVTLHVRTPHYLGEPESSHNRCRNADIMTYLPAVERIIDAGFTVVQIGDLGQPILPEREGLMDYAHSDHKSDWLDIFLMGAARFMVATSSGPMVVAHLFGVPIVLTNAWPQFAPPFGIGDIFLPKRYTWADGAELSPRDMDSPQLKTYQAPQFDRSGVSVVDNTPEELVDSVAISLSRWGS